MTQSYTHTHKNIPIKHTGLPSSTNFDEYAKNEEGCSWKRAARGRAASTFCVISW